MKKRNLLFASTMLSAFLASSTTWAEKPRVSTAPVQQDKALAMDVIQGQNIADPMRMKRREIMLQAHEANKELAEQMSLKRKELDALAKADKFDKAAYLKKHDEMQDIKRKMEDGQASAMAEALSKMSKEDRQVMGSGLGGHRRMMMRKSGMGGQEGAPTTTQQLEKK